LSAQPQINLENGCPPAVEECRALVDRIAASQEFRRAKRLRAFLVYVVDRHLAGEPNEINETLIGHRVFGRPAGYNSGDDSIVRTEARNLRLRLERYFAGEGASEATVMEIPRGGYVPLFRHRPVAQPSVPDSVPVSRTPESMTRRRWFWMAAPAAGVAALAAARVVPGLHSDSKARLSVRELGAVSFESSDSALTQAFLHARQRALACVYTGDPIGDWYASSPQADAFCMRDLSHESLGASVLGLTLHTRNMLRRFALSVAHSRRWCGYWLITKDGFPSPQSYFNDADFGYCLPATLDLVRACCRQFLWTGDRTYLDADFSAFYDHTVVSFVSAWDKEHTGLMKADPERKRISGSYRQHAPYLTGADLVAAQYAAYETYAKIQEFKGASGSLSARRGAEYRTLSGVLRHRFNNEWWNPAMNRFHSGLMADGSFDPTYADQSNVYSLWFGIPEPGPRTEASLDWMERSRPKYDSNFSYYPETLYRYGRNESARRFLLEIADPGFSGYGLTETAFAVVGAVASGLMGVAPDAPRQTIETLPRLTAQTAWARMSSLPFFLNNLSIEHRGPSQTTVVNQAGPDLQWKASFATSDPARILVDGVAVPVTLEQRPEGKILSALIPLSAGHSRTAILRT
jgi:hypothetical protein